MKIVSVGGLVFSDEQNNRLKKIGDFEIVPDPGSDEAWLKAVNDADVIMSDGSYLYANLDKLENVMATYPFIELGSFDSAELEKKGVYITNSRGSNRDSIVQWTMFMILSLLRNFGEFVNTRESHDIYWGDSLSDMSVLIVGSGSIGSEVGKVCEAFGADVSYFKRGDDLAKMSADVDVVVNALNCNPSSEKLLDADFFKNLKKGARYVTFVRQFTYDLDAVMEALHNGTLAGAAIDCDPEALFQVDNKFYQAVLAENKILATPHIAFSTEQARRNGVEQVVKNVEAYVAGKPINVLHKQ